MRLLSLAIPAAALGLAACAWSVPADPGLNVARRSPDALMTAAPSSGGARGEVLAGPGTDDPVARSLYVRHCGRCHQLYAPSHLPADAWPGMVRTMGPRAGLFGANRERVTRWLVASSR